MKIFKNFPLTATPATGDSHCLIEDQEGNIIAIVEGDECEDKLAYERASRIARCVNLVNIIATECSGNGTRDLLIVSAREIMREAK